MEKGLPYGDQKLFSQFSLGMKQRLAIALAVMHDPELLILDEPINGLDPIGIAEVCSFIRELCEARGKTILISSHILSEIALLADDIGIIDHGVLLEEESFAELEQKNSKYVHLRFPIRPRRREFWSAGRGGDDVVSVIITFFYTMVNYILSTSTPLLTQSFGLNPGTLLPGPLALRWFFQFYDHSNPSEELAALLEKISPYLNFSNHGRLKKLCKFCKKRKSFTERTLMLEHGHGTIIKRGIIQKMTKERSVIENKSTEFYAVK